MFNLYKHIESLAKERGFQSMQELCDAAGVWASTMTNLNSGRSTNISKKTAQKFADTLGVSVDVVFGREIKEPATTAGDGFDEKLERAMKLLSSLPDYQQDMIIAQLEGLSQHQSNRGVQ